MEVHPGKASPRQAGVVLPEQGAEARVAHQLRKEGRWRGPALRRTRLHTSLGRRIESLKSSPKFRFVSGGSWGAEMLEVS